MAPIGVPGPDDGKPTDLATFAVKVDGTPLPTTFSLVALDITRAVNRIPTATLVLQDGDAAKQTFEASSGEQLVPGKSIEISGGYGTDNEVLFKGIITRQRIQVKRQSDSLLHVEAKDAAFRMTLDRRSRTLTELSDSDVIEQIIAEHAGLTAEVEATTAKHPEVVQYQVSDWDFVVLRAERIGMVCVPSDGTLRVAKPSAAGAPALTLTYGQGIFDVDLEIDARWQYPSVTANAWDPANQELASADLDDVPAPAQGNLAPADLAQAGALKTFALGHTGDLPAGDLDAWSTAQMVKSRFAKVRGTVRIQGTSKVQPNSLVALAGLGDRFNGAAFVSGVRHLLGDGDWETVVQLGLDPQWHHERFAIQPCPASGFNTAVGGLQIGVVTQLASDPSGEDRVQVKLPVIGAEATGTWARLATLFADKDFGSVFRPEIGAEVVVGFLNEDPHHPVILGSLHSSAKAAPLPAADENDEKGVVTRSGMKLVFNDKDPSVTIETKAGNKVVISDADEKITITDQAGSTVTMSSDGIALESPADVTIKATGDVTIEGTNVTVTASASLTTEGSATAAFKSGGTTELKGSLVQIN
jgi:Rhs element Vgr protein